MDVFVIPVAADRYELYSEQPVAEDEPIEPERHGVLGRLRRKITAMLRDVETRQRNGTIEDTGGMSWAGRLQDRAMAWAAERIAEQRLLWNLRSRTAVVAAHPEDMAWPDVCALVRQSLQADADRHRRWMLIDGVLFLVTFVLLGPLFVLIPGIANLPALYFGFRTVGHFLSMRGATHGLTRVAWSGRPCPPLDELRRIATMDPAAREPQLIDIATRLRLENLPHFFDRVAIPRRTPEP